MNERDFEIKRIASDAMAPPHAAVTASSDDTIRIAFEHGTKGIVLRADGTAETWGDYRPVDAAKAFFDALRLVISTANPKGSA